MAGWPWPLDAVQVWFEGLWNWIESSAKAAVSIVSTWVNNAAAWLWSRITEVGGWLWERFQEIGAGLSKLLSDAGTTLLKTLSDLAGSLGSGIVGFFTWVGDQLSRVGQWITGTVFGWIDGSLRWLTDTFRWLQGVITNTGQWIVDELSGFLEDVPAMLGNIGDFVYGAVMDAGDWIVDQVGVAFDGASIAIGETIKSVFSPILDPFGSFLRIFSGIATEFDPTKLISEATYNLSQLMRVVSTAFQAKSPRTPEEAFRLTWDTINETTTIFMAQATSLTIAEALSLGQLDISPQAFLHTPQLDAAYRLVGELYSVMAEASLVIPLKQYYMRAFTPMIPPTEDLIRFVVREVIPPTKFYEYMPLTGFSDEIAEWYWEAHWILPPLTILYDAYHRGVISREELDKYVVLHDYKPEPRPGIAKSDQEIVRSVIKTLIPRVDLRYAWEIGRLTDEELVEWYERLGYEEDSELMADIQKVRAMTEEIGKVRTEWIYDYVEGFIEEDTLRANLASLGHSALRQDYYVEYGRKKRDRTAAKKRLAIYHDAYLKDLITEDGLEARTREILVDPVAIELFLEDAYIDKYKKPTPPKPEKIKVATLAYLCTAFREDIISEDELRAELERRLYTPESIATIIEVETLKKVKAAGE